MKEDSDRAGRPVRKTRISTTFGTVLPRVLVVGTDTGLRTRVLATLQARGIVAEALGSGIGAMQKINDAKLDMALIMDLVDAMSPEAVIKLLRDNVRTRDMGIVCFVDPRSEVPAGVDGSIGHGTLGDLTDIIFAAWKKRAGPE